jgi:hypothetical protein
MRTASDQNLQPQPTRVADQGKKPKLINRDFARWRSLGESNPCFSLERAKSIRSMTILKRVDVNPDSSARAGATAPSFAPETTQLKRNERDRIETKRQQHQRSQSLSRRS